MHLAENMSSFCLGEFATACNAYPATSNFHRMGLELTLSNTQLCIYMDDQTFPCNWWLLPPRNLRREGMLPVWLEANAWKCITKFAYGLRHCQCPGRSGRPWPRSLLTRTSCSKNPVIAPQRNTSPLCQRVAHFGSAPTPKKTTKKRQQCLPLQTMTLAVFSRVKTWLGSSC